MAEIAKTSTAASLGTGNMNAPPTLLTFNQALMLFELIAMAAGSLGKKYNIN